jgi:acyl-CoA thioesterase I
MKQRKFFAYLAGALALAACATILLTQGITTPNDAAMEGAREQSSTSPADDSAYVIISFGDSLTAGYGVSLEDAYPRILEGELLRSGRAVRVINMGVSGEATTGGLERVDFVLSQKPSLVLLGLGANDMLRASSPEIARANLDAIIIRLKNAGVDTILLGMRSVASNGDTYRADFDSIYPLLAQKHDIPLVPFFLEGVALDPTLNIPDGIHPNRAGYEKIVRDNIMPTLLPIIDKRLSI